MWECPKCKRIFKRNHQSHYCEKPKTIEEYIQFQPESVQPLLYELHETIMSALPDVERRISWSMPTYRNKVNIVQFAANKHHIGLYVGIEAVEYFRESLFDYKVHKGTIQFPYKKLPIKLIKEIVKWCYNIQNKGESYESKK